MTTNVGLNLLPRFLLTTVYIRQATIPTYLKYVHDGNLDENIDFIDCTFRIYYRCT